MFTSSKVLASALGATIALFAASSLAGPQPAEQPAAAGEQPATAAAPAAAPAPAGPSAATVRRQMEDDMGVLGDLASEARRAADPVRAACVIDKQERGQGVMELATGELLVIQDSGSTADAKSFATQKLQAASNRMGGLVEQARGCMGDQPGTVAEGADNSSEEEPSIPWADPTQGGGANGAKPPRVPPPVDDGAPPTVGSPVV